MLNSCNFPNFFFLFNKFLSLLSWCSAACELGLVFSQSLNSRFVIWQSASNQGLWQCLFLQLLPEGLLPKVDSAITPTHCYSRSANPFAPRCPIESTTHRFPRLIIKVSWYFSAFDLSYFNLGKKKLLQPYVVVQQNYNRCSTVGATTCGQNLHPSCSSRCHLLSLRGV